VRKPCGATSDVGYGPKADIFDAFQLAIFDDLAHQVVALRTLKGAFIVCRFVRLNPREPHRRSAFPTNRQIENEAGRIEDIFRLRHRFLPSYGRGCSAPCAEQGAPSLAHG
jgi:hypothetical protein